MYNSLYIKIIKFDFKSESEPKSEFEYLYLYQIQSTKYNSPTLQILKMLNCHYLLFNITCLDLFSQPTFTTATVYYDTIVY